MSTEKSWAGEFVMTQPGELDGEARAVLRRGQTRPREIAALHLVIEAIDRIRHTVPSEGLEAREGVTVEDAS